MVSTSATGTAPLKPPHRRIAWYAFDILFSFFRVNLLYIGTRIYVTHALANIIMGIDINIIPIECFIESDVLKILNSVNPNNRKTKLLVINTKYSQKWFNVSMCRLFIVLSVVPPNTIPAVKVDITPDTPSLSAIIKEA